MTPEEELAAHKFGGSIRIRREELERLERDSAL